MKFEFPSFLWAMLLLLVPIIIHLFHFRRFKKVIFPHVRYLLNIQKETQSVKKLKNLLVLLARCAALIFLVFAFAQPYIPLANQAKVTGDDVVTVYIDNSFSMEAAGKEGPVFEEAKVKAREIIKAQGSSTRFLIVDNTGKGTGRLINRDDAIQRVDELTIAQVPHDLTETMKLIRFSLDKNGVGNKPVFIISDFQKPETPYSSLSFLDSTFQVTGVAVNSVSTRNISIDSAWLESPQLQVNEAFTLMVKVTNRGTDEINESTITLDVNGVRKSAAGFDLQPGESKELSMGVTLTNAGWLEGILKIEDEDLSFDNSYFITFNIKDKIRVLAIHGHEPNQFINKLFGNDSYFVLTNSNQGNLDLSLLAKADLLILNDLDGIGNGIVSAIKTYADQGGTVFIIPKATASNEYLNNLLTELRLPKLAGLETSNLDVSKVDITHPLFERVFDRIPNNPDFPKTSKHYALSTGSGAMNLMTLSNEHPYLVGNTLGNGHCYLLAGALDANWSNFPQHALFVPILLKMSMSRSSDLPMSYTIQRQNLCKTVADGSHLQGELRLKLGEQEWMPVINQKGLTSYVDVGDGQMSAGNIKLTHRDSLLQVVSYNYNRRESEAKKLDKSELTTFFSGSRFMYSDETAVNLSKTISDQQLGKRFWKLCVILSLIFLAIEILLLRLWTNTPFWSKSSKNPAVANE